MRFILLLRVCNIIILQQSAVSRICRLCSRTTHKSSSSFYPSKLNSDLLATPPAVVVVRFTDRFSFSYTLCVLPRGTPFFIARSGQVYRNKNISKFVFFFSIENNEITFSAAQHGRSPLPLLCPAYRVYARHHNR